MNAYGYSSDNPITKSDPNGRDASAISELPPALEALSAIGLLGTSEFWGPVVGAGVLVVAGGAAVVTGGDAIYNLYKNSNSGAPGLGRAVELVSGDNGGPINIDPNSPKWMQLIVKGAAVTSIAGGIVCGEMDPSLCGKMLHVIYGAFNPSSAQGSTPDKSAQIKSSSTSGGNGPPAAAGSSRSSQQSGPGSRAGQTSASGGGGYGSTGSVYTNYVPGNYHSACGTLCS